MLLGETLMITTTTMKWEYRDFEENVPVIHIEIRTQNNTRERTTRGAEKNMPLSRAKK